MVRARSAAASETGPTRTWNEDRALADDALGVYAAIDGTGGYHAGADAADLIVATLREHFAPGGGCARSASLDDAVLDAVQVAHERIVARAAAEARWRGQGATLAMLALRGGEARLVHVGDARAYRYRGGRLERLTNEHMLHNELRRTGQPITEALRFLTSVVLRVVGIPASGAADLRVEPIANGDVFVLCSDGLYNALADDAIAAALLRAGDEPTRAAAAMVAEACDAGAEDNATAVVVEVLEA